MPPAITPVFVVGMPRSGTKWLSNILCNHPQIAGVQSQRHCGIIETNMFGAMPAKFDLSNPDDYLACIELWAQTDFFRQLGITKAALLMRPWPQNHVALFTKVMQELALRQRKTFWIQKISPERALTVLPQVPGSRCIAIQRDLIDNIKSDLQLKSNKGGRPSVFEATYSTVAQTKALQRVRRRHADLTVRYEQLRRSPQAVVQNICQHLMIEFDPELLEVRFRRNTSFHGRRHPAVDFVARHPQWVRLLARGLDFIPLVAMRGYSRLKASLHGAPPVPFIRGTFAELERELHGCESVCPPIPNKKVGML